MSSSYPLQTLSQRSSFTATQADMSRLENAEAGPSTPSRSQASSRQSTGLLGANGKMRKKRLSDVSQEDLDDTLDVEDDELGALLGEAAAGVPTRRTSVRGHDPPASKGDQSRTIPLHTSSKGRRPYPPNVVRNQKYTVVSFLPLVFYEQFKFFFNFYFLVVALSQFVPALKIGYIVTYVAPLAFVIAITMGKEAYDDYSRYLRDREANSTRYLVVLPIRNPTADLPNVNGSNGDVPKPETKSTPSSAIRVGDLVLLEKNQRVPADMVLLTTSEEEGTCFIRTDQLDGETDWKLKVAVSETQRLGEGGVGAVEGSLYADPPIKDIHTFYGALTLNSTSPGPQSSTTIPLNVENVLWANTVLAAGSAVGMVVYTGRETRAVLNTSEPETKMGTLEKEVNKMAKILCTVTFALSVCLVALNGFRGQWYIYVFRFLILFSSIIPISLRVNLDMGKTVYAHQIQTDPEIPETIVRTSTLPEELGRVEYLLSDKTGTLTRNEMELKKLHMGTVVFGFDSMDEVAHLLASTFTEQDENSKRQNSVALGIGRSRRDMSSRVRDAVVALATCHNVTPVTNDDGSITYQASSPDEVAIVQWTESVGLTLVNRDRTSMTLQTPSGNTLTFDILTIFPFTSESKRMGIIVRNRETSEITFVQKGADVIMAKIVQTNDWLEEECGNMAREGLRTLVLGRKKLSQATYEDFDRRFRAAQVSEDRATAVPRVVEEILESELELLALTGVEDKLQEDVKSTLEILRNAGLRIWMLTGDKIETATNIAVSSKLVARGQFIHQVAKLKSADQIRDMLDFLQARLDACLVIDGESLQLCLDLFRNEFIMLATQLPAVVACRCSPTQKADVARLIREFTKKTVCCIGDGGNDVSMIQAADVGVGIVGKEGKQASLAADFSITQFSNLTKLLLWHGRNSYKRSAKLSQFVIHRGLIIAVIQAVFSSIFFFAPIALYQGWLQVGYATLYTMAPVFSLVLDRDVNEDLALLYPELYKELTKGRSLSYKTFFTWLTISVYQGGIIMLLSLLLFETEFLHIVAISFTALVLNELIMVALEITTWHSYMILSEVGTAVVYFGSMAVLPAYFDLRFVLSATFFTKVAIIVAISSMPLYFIKVFHHACAVQLLLSPGVSFAPAEMAVSRAADKRSLHLMPKIASIAPSHILQGGQDALTPLPSELHLDLTPSHECHGFPFSTAVLTLTTSANMATNMGDEKNLDIEPAAAPKFNDIEPTESKTAEAIAAETYEKDMPLRQVFREYWRAILWSIAISACLVMEGYDTNLLSNLLSLSVFREKYGRYTGKEHGYQLEASWQSAITQSSTVGNVFGIFIASWLQDRYGYRRTIQISLIFVTGAIFVVFFSPSVEVLMVGELLCGFPWGAFSSSAVAYASEISPIRLRGYLTTIYVNLCWIIGQLIAGGVIIAVQDKKTQWAFRLPWALQWMWVVPLFLFATFAPESPWFLVRKGKLQEAERSIERLRSKHSSGVSARDTVAMMVRTNRIEQRLKEGGSYLDCFKGPNLRRTEIACVAWAVTVWSGSSFANHVSYFLQQAGLSTRDALSINMGQRALGFVGTLGSWIIMTRFGRRSIFLTGLSFNAISLLVIGILYFPGRTSVEARWGEAAMTLVWVFVWDFSVTVTAYAIVGESSSTRLRGKTVGLARNLYNISGLTGGIISAYQTNPTAWDWEGRAGFFWFGTCCLCILWTYFRLPEMKGRSFRELDILFGRNISARRFKSTEIGDEEEE